MSRPRYTDNKMFSEGICEPRRRCHEPRRVWLLRDCHLHLQQSLLLTPVRQPGPLPRSVSQGWHGRGKAVQKDIFLSLHIYCMLKYLWPQHTWHIKKTLHIRRMLEKCNMAVLCRFWETDVIDTFAECPRRERGASQLSHSWASSPHRPLHKASRALGFEAEHADLLASSALAPLELFLVQHVEIQPLIFLFRKSMWYKVHITSHVLCVAELSAMHFRIKAKAPESF